MTQQQRFHAVTLEKALFAYRTGVMKACDLLWNYFGVQLAPGWQQNFNLSEVRRLLGIPHTTFWRAIKRLRDVGLIITSSFRAGSKVTFPYDFVPSGEFEDLPDDSQSEAEQANCPEPAFFPARPQTRGVGFERKSQRSSGSKPKKKDVRSAYPSFLQTLPVEQRRDFEAFCKRQMQNSTFKINLPESWLNAHHLDYWAEFERQYVKSQAPTAAVEIPQKLKDAIAAGKARLERHFSGGEFRTGVLSLDGKGWFNSIADWLASC